VTAPVAFFSFTHNDNTALGGKLERLRERLEQIIRTHTGLAEFQVFIDKDRDNGIAWGQKWAERINEALHQSVFLIPIVSPTYLKRDWCRHEFTEFLNVEVRLLRGRPGSPAEGLIHPILILDEPLLRDKEHCAKDIVSKTLVERQWIDFQDLQKSNIQQDDPIFDEKLKIIGERIRDVYRRLQPDAIRQDQRAVLGIQAFDANGLVAINEQRTPALHGLISAATEHFQTVGPAKPVGDQYRLLFGSVDDAVLCGVAVLQQFIDHPAKAWNLPENTQLRHAVDQGEVTERPNGDLSGAAIETVSRLLTLDLSKTIPGSGELNAEQIAAIEPSRMLLDGEAAPQITRDLSHREVGVLKHNGSAFVVHVITAAECEVIPLPNWTWPAIQMTESPPPLVLKLKPNTSPKPSNYTVKGLAWYEESEADRFFGREHDVDELVRLLQHYPVVLLKGASGVGKSSLVHAGLTPRLREQLGWRVCVVRPYQMPSTRLPEELSRELLAEGTFSEPLDAARLRAEVVPLLSSDRCHSLVIILDQFEEIVWADTPPEETEAVRRFLQEIYRFRDQRPFVRVVCVYRHDADLRLETLWQEISGRSSGLEYRALEGLSVEAAAKVLTDQAHHGGWTLKVAPLELCRRLAQQSRSVVTSDQVFPPFLQIVMARVAVSEDKILTDEFLSQSGDVAGIIGDWLKQSLDSLDQHADERIHARRVLESLSRASGAKATRDFDELRQEAGRPEAELRLLLRKLEEMRLIRSVGGGYEIQHDRLAAAVLSDMSEERRESKASLELLDARIAKFEKTKQLLDITDLTDLFRHRLLIEITPRRKLFIAASRLVAGNDDANDACDLAIGWYWFEEDSVEQYRDGLSQLLRSPRTDVRQSVVKAITQFEQVDDLPVLREMAKDGDTYVRQAAVEAIGQFQQFDDLRLLREIAKEDRYIVVLEAVVSALAKFESVEALPLIRELVKDENVTDAIRGSAVAALAKFQRLEDLRLLRQMATGPDENLRYAAVWALAEFQRGEDLPLIREMAKDDDANVRQAVAWALAKFQSIADLPLLREMAKNEELWVRGDVVVALAKFQLVDDLPLLRELGHLKDHDLCVSVVDALAEFQTVEALPVFRDMAKDESQWIRKAVAQALGRFQSVEDLPLLREMAMDKSNWVRQAVVAALAEFQSIEDLQFIREMARDENYWVREAVMDALAEFQSVEDLPLLREMSTDEDNRVRTAAVNAVLSIDDRDAIEEWLIEKEDEMQPDVLRMLDEFLYAPDWWKDLQKPKQEEEAAEAE